MKAKKIYIVLLLISLFLIIFFVLKNNSKEKEQLYNWGQYEIDSYNLTQLKGITSKELKFDNIKTNPNLYLLTESGDKISIKSIRNKFVIRFRDIGCSSCVQSFIDHIEEMNKFINGIGTDNVVLLINTDNVRDIVIFKKKNKIPCNIYALSLNQLPTEILDKDENIMAAYYYFIISNRYLIQNIFIPIQNFQERNDLYIESIGQYFDSKLADY